MLDLNSNEFETIPAAVCSLDQLAILDLSRNYLIALRPEIGHLQNLVILNLSGDIEGRNQLTSLPPEIGELTRLKRLDLSMTHLETLPPEIRQLTNLKELNLRDTFLPIPTEVLWRIADPTTTIETYFSYLVGQKRPLNEVKLVLLGEGGVGKTSLISRLLHDTYYPPMDKTEGIEIHSWEIANSRNGKSTSEMSEPSIRLNVWDFGGQEIMHATHQFFLTKRTLYVLVLDNRLSEAENRVDYWLTLIRSFGGDSPVLIVGNKRDQHALDLDRRGLLAAYPTVQAILETSCKTGEGILALRDAIAEQVLAMPHVSDPIVTTWFEIKAALEALDADYIPYGDYLRLCREKNVSNPDSQRVLLGFLHDLGVVLHFPDPRLETTNILNPKWVTQGVYRILNTRLTFEEPGILTWSMLARILHDEPYQEKRLFILDMMQKFELCYEMLDRPHTYLIPDLLPKEARDTGPWEGALSFEVHYPVLPGSILTRFIVRMHRHIKDQTVWRTGVLLFCEGNESIVRADLTANRITIAVRGPGPSGRRDLLTRIREYLGAIHATIADLRPAEKVPVPGHPDIPPVDYEWLRNLERKGVPKFYPPGLTEPISVSKLLNGVESPTARHAYPDSLSALRVQLQQLDDVEIDALCIDHFPQVYRAFGRGLRRDEKINQLLAHCLHKPEETHHLAALLLNE
jgi:internalin A